ncbi:hypothetical protein Golax_020592, partial [Gossypium laxum]|nr:hypothetical protein [Gossypium laxum]
SCLSPSVADHPFRPTTNHCLGYWEPFSAVVPLPRAGSYVLLTHSPLETPLQIQLAYVMHAASINPESGSNSL